METMLQPKVTGYRKLGVAEVNLMNEAKELAEQVGAFVEKLRQLPATGVETDLPESGQTGDFPRIDHRWVSIGATQLQQGFMALIRGIAQPTTF
jgi:hypothetical protein